MHIYYYSDFERQFFMHLSCICLSEEQRYQQPLFFLEDVDTVNGFGKQKSCLYVEKKSGLLTSYYKIGSLTSGFLSRTSPLKCNCHLAVYV